MMKTFCERLEIGDLYKKREIGKNMRENRNEFIVL